jgi:hypothetical protein
VGCGVWSVGCGVWGVGCGGWGVGVGDRAIDARRNALELIHLRFRVPPETERTPSLPTRTAGSLFTQVRTEND